ncbi:MAG: ribosome maturation factor RimP [Firmicutes bacterium]|nr:ribosome maturation factor RimP [Bacillota bacterium]
MDLKKLQPAIERQLALLGFELVLLEAAKEGRDEVLRLYIDHTNGQPVTLDDCVAANDGLVAWMDVEFPSLREEVGLEISSPGLERPLVKPDHFRRFAGRLCRVQALQPVNGQKRFKGWIGEATHDSVTLEEDGVLKTIPFDNIQKARLAPFDESKTPQPRIVARAATDATAGVETSSGEEA